MTFTEDDLRSVKSRQSPYDDQISTPVIRSETPQRILTPKRTTTPTRLLTPPRVTTPPIQKVAPLLRVSTSEQDREYQLRQQEKQQKENEAHLKEQLKRLEEERTSSRKVSNAKATRLFPENEYKRFSNSRYYKWDSDEDIRKEHHHHSHDKHVLDETFHEEHCELCRRGLEHERLERERHLAQLRARSRSEHCRTIQRFCQ
uniref:Uncharacterized protein n=1 Tax=Panagrolaimus sp. ES5 TaxID=591445 RepID=A0AC34F223_9BILA